MSWVSPIYAALIACIAWFIIGGVLYFNPYVWKIYKKYKKNPAVRIRDTFFFKKDAGKYWIFRIFLLGVAVQCFIFALVYAFIQPILPGDLFLNTCYFGLILVGVKIFPRMIDTWIQSRYPVELLLIEFCNGTIGCFLIAFICAIFI